MAAPPASSTESSAHKITASVFIHGTFKGEPAITIPKDVEATLATRFEKTLIGKFSQGKPTMDLIRKFLAVQNFTGHVAEGLLDGKHILFRFEESADYIRIFSKPIWNVFGMPMRILKWTPDFQIDREPSIIPIWISLPRLPIHLINEEFIFSLVSSFSKPLRIDNATASLKRPSVARVQVEFDLFDLLPSRIWVQNETGNGFWQSVLLDTTLPSYCKYCWHIGHEEHACAVKYPELKQSKQSYVYKREIGIQKVFRPKPQFEEHMKGTSQPEKNDIKMDQQVANELVNEVFGTGKEQAEQSTKICEEEEIQIRSKELNSIVDDTHKFGVASGQAMPAASTADSAQMANPTKNVVEPAMSVNPSFSAELQQKLHLPMVSTPGNDPSRSEVVKESSRISEEITLPRDLAINNSFGNLSLDTENQNELQYMDLEGFKIRSMGYNSDKDGKIKLTPSQKIKRTRKKKKVFDL